MFKFFGTVGPEQIDGLWGNKSFAFRQSKAFENNKWATYAWLKKGEIEAQKISCEEYNKKKFKKALYKIKALTNGPPEIFVPELQSLCAASGAAVVFIPGIKGIRASGVTQWLAPNKALIQLSLRYKRSDHLEKLKYLPLQKNWELPRGLSWVGCSMTVTSNFLIIRIYL